ncbi:MAG: NTP transferase domain-containing protein [Deltaproteobacteria bacterium]|nr:NTP transferase domain-containing protein [Deltaproteobacteria bacterium]
MKTIVVSGACSNIGKTTLARELSKILPQAEFVKIGTGKKKESNPDTLYPFSSYFKHLKENHSKAHFLIIESNTILTELKSDLCIYLDGQTEKPSALLAKQRADLIRGSVVSQHEIRSLAQRLDISVEKMKEICFLAGVNPVPVTALILTGGESSRMGKDKGHLTINGKILIVHLYELLAQFFDEVIISVAKKTGPVIPNALITPDLIPGKGPLMGIYSGISASSNKVNFVIACDIPRVEFSLLRKLLSCSLQYDIVVPSFESGKYEPLFAVYTKKVLTSAKALLDNDRRRVSDLFSLCKTKIVKASNTEWYANLNTPEDYHNFMRGDGGIVSNETYMPTNRHKEG